MATIAQLEAALDRLSDKDRATAQDMIARSRQWGRFTEKQSAFADSMISRATAVQAAGSVDLSKLHGMFADAMSMKTGNGALKKPFVRFLTQAEERFTVSLAPLSGRNAGSLYVKAADIYVGKIDHDGNFSSARDVEPTRGFQILEELRQFCVDPAKAAKMYGQRTGECCFCKHELTDARSRMAGYGPICADNWGLPIPSKAEAAAWDAAQNAAA